MPTSPARPGLPQPRGELSAAVVAALSTRVPGSVRFRRPRRGVDALGDDVQLALWCCYALHYHGFAGVPDDWEWDPELLRFRAALEAAFLTRVRDEIGGPRPLDPCLVPDRLRVLASGDGGPSLSRELEAHGTFTQAREFLVHRAVYQTKEADPHTWVIPRVVGAAKAALVEIQHDEYGAGDPAAVHAELFRATLEWSGVSPDAVHRGGGSVADRVPAATLATDNLVTGFGLHRARRGACLGHLALFEMTSTGPMARYAAMLRRLGAPPSARRFYEAHVAADALHEVIALEMVEQFLAVDPAQAGNVVFGARALQWVEARFARTLLDAWAHGRSSLRGERAVCAARGREDQPARRREPARNSSIHRSATRRVTN